MQNVWFCQVVFIFTYILESGRCSILSVGDNHFVFDDQRSYLTALAIRVFRPDACHAYITLVQFQLFLFRVHLVSIQVLVWSEYETEVLFISLVIKI